MKPKEWLFKNGHIDKIGRGRLSAEHKALIADAVSKGAQIEGFGITPRTAQKETEPKVAREVSAAGRILDCPDPLRDGREFRVVSKDTGKPIPMVGPATVCNGCHNSLTYCPCAAPRVWVDSETEAVVAFKAANV